VIEKAKSEKIAEKIGSYGLPPAVIAALYTGAISAPANLN